MKAILKGLAKLSGTFETVAPLMDEFRERVGDFEDALIDGRRGEARDAGNAIDDLHERLTEAFSDMRDEVKRGDMEQGEAVVMHMWRREVQDTVSRTWDAWQER